MLLIIINFLLLLCNKNLAVQVIYNGLAQPEIIHTPISIIPKCTIKAEPLDLIFLLDSSGSLKDKFQDEIDVIRRIVKHVTIGENATRVLLVQFSGTQHLEFDFKKFSTRDDILSALDVLRHVSGITKVGGALEFVQSMLNAEKGMRDSNVKKIIYLLSDGRTHDFPKDSEIADQLLQISNLEIWAYGTGEYVAMSELMKITQNKSKIITNKNLNILESLFDKWHGIEVCEKQPVCIKGSDKPLDLVIIIDSSESIRNIFYDQIAFIINRILNNTHIHPEAVRLSLVTFSGSAFLHFNLNDMKFVNNVLISNYLNSLRPIKGITSAHLAFELAYEILTNNTKTSQARLHAEKLIIILTDGRSSLSSATILSKIRNKQINIIAISLKYPKDSDNNELLVMTGNNKSHVFTLQNIKDFEKSYLRFIGFGCPGLTLGPYSMPRVRGATDVTCNLRSLTLTVRTQRPMNGLIYAQKYHDNVHCFYKADGNSRELKITFTEGNCGLVKIPTANFSGFNFNIIVILQFHPLIITRADQGLEVSCFYPHKIAPEEANLFKSQSLIYTKCSYSLHRFSPEDCIALDAKVGENLFHKWECDNSPSYKYLVHNCYARSKQQSVKIIDDDGCEIDPYFLKTPNYSKIISQNVSNKLFKNIYVYQEMSAFKFPKDNNVIFQCEISFCEVSSCGDVISPKNCDKSSSLLFDSFDTPKRARMLRMINSNNINNEHNSKIELKKAKFLLTLNIETRILNVIENEAIRSSMPVHYCDVRN